MKVNDLEKELPPIGVLAQASFNGVAEQLKERPTRAHVHEDKMSYWQLILLQSKANGCFYHGEELPQFNWEWPKNTWFQDRLTHHLKALEFAAHQARK